MPPRKSVTQNDLYTQIDSADIERQARLDWERDKRRRRDLSTRFVVMMPWFQLIVFVVFYLLSVPKCG